MNKKKLGRNKYLRGHAPPPPPPPGPLQPQSWAPIPSQSSCLAIYMSVRTFICPGRIRKKGRFPTWLTVTPTDDSDTVHKARNSWTQCWCQLLLALFLGSPSDNVQTPSTEFGCLVRVYILLNVNFAAVLSCIYTVFLFTTFAYILVMGKESQFISECVCSCTAACKPFNHYINRVLIVINLYRIENRWVFWPPPLPTVWKEGTRNRSFVSGLLLHAGRQAKFAYWRMSSRSVFQFNTQVTFHSVDAPFISKILFCVNYRSYRSRRLSKSVIMPNHYKIRK
jgi:hypothetical protein